MANAADNFQWNADNVFQYGNDLNPLAMQVGAGADGVRDTLAQNRDAFLQPYYNQFRQGTKADAGDQTLFNDAGFQNFVKTGALPQNATPAQQWNAQPGTPGATQGSLMSLLMQRAQQSPVVGREDPNVRAQADAFSAAQQRGARNTIADLAESQGPLANLGAETRLANERAAQASGGFEAELLARAQQQRAQEIQDNLSLWGSLMSADQRNALERELAQMSNQTQRASLAQNNDQFLRELALRENNQNNQWDFNWAALGL